MLAYNAQTLAYIGDAVYELYVREQLLASGKVKTKDLHRTAITYTEGPAQSRALKTIEPLLSEEELSVVKRGRNAPLSRKSRKGDLMEYKIATGFEALLGHLHLTGQHKRLYELLSHIV